MGNSNIVDLMIKNKELIMVPLETMRGRNFDNSIVIIDEAQNLTMSELCCISTRIGENSKLILCGDERQSDLTNRDFNTFAELLLKHSLTRTSVVTFSSDDCVRSGLVKDLLRMFEEEKIY